MDEEGFSPTISARLKRRLLHQYLGERTHKLNFILAHFPALVANKSYKQIECRNVWKSESISSGCTQPRNLMPGEEEDVDNHLARFAVARQTQFNPKHKPFRGALGVLPSEVQLVTIPG